jgi:hypothetical protein
LGLASAQSIVTIAGLPYSHRDAVDGKAALSAPLNNVYGILFDKVTGRLLIHDVRTLFRLEPDGTLLAMVGMGRWNDGTIAHGTLSSGLYAVTFRGMVQDATGAVYLADASTQRVYRVGLDGVVTTFAGGGTKPPGMQSDGGLATDAGLYSPRGLVTRTVISTSPRPFATAFARSLRRESSPPSSRSRSSRGIFCISKVWRLIRKTTFTPPCTAGVLFGRSPRTDRRR